MANSKYEYVKTFERPDTLLPNTWIVVRIDGRGFHKLSAKYGFEKPNDRRALDLMNAAAVAVMSELPDVVVAYGVSDEFSFVFQRSCSLFERRESKITTTVVSTITASYTHQWPLFFPDQPLTPPLPSFDGRAVLYPTLKNMRDYLSWRQVDCHINNLYNTTFWALVLKGGMGATEAEETLKGSYAADKNEILFSKFGINYNNEAEIYRKGSVCYRDYGVLTTKSDVTPSSGEDVGEEDTEGMAEGREQSKTQREKERKRKAKAPIVVEHVDIIKDEFWGRRPWLLSDKPGKAGNKPVQ